MGEVWNARQIPLDRVVAIKTIQTTQVDDIARSLFVAEAHITGRLEHPGIVPVHSFGVAEDGRPSLVMKKIDGMEWDELLHPCSEAGERRASRLTLHDHLRILLRVCDAVAFAHAQGVIHRDIKPANVMVGEFGEVLLGDWGIALQLERRPTQAEGRTAIFGTPAYMAPELADGDEARWLAGQALLRLGLTDAAKEELTEAALLAPARAGQVADLLQEPVTSPGEGLGPS